MLFSPPQGLFFCFTLPQPELEHRGIVWEIPHGNDFRGMGIWFTLFTLLIQQD